MANDTFVFFCDSLIHTGWAILTQFNLQATITGNARVYSAPYLSWLYLVKMLDNIKDSVCDF